MQAEAFVTDAHPAGLEADVLQYGGLPLPRGGKEGMKPAADLAFLCFLFSEKKLEYKSTFFSYSLFLLRFFALCRMSSALN